MDQMVVVESCVETSTTHACGCVLVERRAHCEEKIFKAPGSGTGWGKCPHCETGRVFTLALASSVLHQCVLHWQEEQMPLPCCEEQDSWIVLQDSHGQVYVDPSCQNPAHWRGNCQVKGHFPYSTVQERWSAYNSACDLANDVEG